MHREIASLFLALICAQYSATKFGWKWLKPATYLDACANFCVTAWEYLGRAAAYACSYLTYLNFQAVFQAICDLLYPLFRIIWAPVNFAAGYAAVVQSYVLDDQFLTYFGTFSAILLVGYLIAKYWRNEWTVKMQAFWQGLHPFWQWIVFLSVCAFFLGIFFIYPGVFVWSQV